jgi:hypothetical protein
MPQFDVCDDRLATSMERTADEARADYNEHMGQEYRELTLNARKVGNQKTLASR